MKTSLFAVSPFDSSAPALFAFITDADSEEILRRNLQGTQRIDLAGAPTRTLLEQVPGVE